MPTKNVYNPSDHVIKVILTATRVSPGIRTDALASETSLCESTISTAGRILVERGLLRRERKGRYYHYYPAGAEDVREPQQLFLSSEPLLEAEIEALKAEIEELRAFKDRALAVHPDLNDPELLKARELAHRILFDAGLRDAADEVSLGLADETKIVKSITEALRRGGLT